MNPNFKKTAQNHNLFLNQMAYDGIDTGAGGQMF